MLDFSEFDILLKNLEEHKNIFCFYCILFSNVYVRMNKVVLENNKLFRRTNMILTFRKDSAIGQTLL